MSNPRGRRNGVSGRMLAKSRSCPGRTVPMLRRALLAALPLLALAFAAPAQEIGKPIPLIQRAAAKSGTSAAPVQPSASEKLDLNNASEAELDALPGIGPAFARKIVENRPYKSKEELARREIVPQATYDK